MLPLPASLTFDGMDVGFPSETERARGRRMTQHQISAQLSDCSADAGAAVRKSQSLRTGVGSTTIANGRSGALKVTDRYRSKPHR
jgi:hypothetical protein